MSLDRINPDGMYDPPNDLYTQVVDAVGERQVHVAGTVARDESGEVVGEDYAEQTELTLANLRRSLDAAGADPGDVVRIVVYALDCDAFLADGYPRVVEFFGDEKPASSLVGVDHLADEDYLLEIEATAVLEG